MMEGLAVKASPQRPPVRCIEYDSRVIEKPGTSNDDHEEYGDARIRNYSMGPVPVVWLTYAAGRSVPNRMTCVGMSLEFTFEEA